MQRKAFSLNVDGPGHFQPNHSRWTGVNSLLFRANVVIHSRLSRSNNIDRTTYRTRFPLFFLTQDLRPFGFAQGRLWANICRPSGLERGGAFCMRRQYESA